MEHINYGVAVSELGGAVYRFAALLCIGVCNMSVPGISVRMGPGWSVSRRSSVMEITGMEHNLSVLVQRNHFS